VYCGSEVIWFRDIFVVLNPLEQEAASIQAA
jgi:hypothetical protein